MLEAKYENSRGDVLAFGDGRGYFINMSDLHDFEWSYETIGDRIAAFTAASVLEHSVPVRIIHPDAAEAVRLKNRLFDVMEYDIVHQTAGKLYIGDWYLPCWCLASAKSSYGDKGYLALALKLVTDRPKWVKESRHILYEESKAGVQTPYLDYPYTYEYDYSPDESRREIVTQEGIEPAEFVLTIAGPVSYPSIVIGSHEYSVDAEIGTGELLIIDSLEKRVYKRKANGEEENLFSKRNRESYIFQPIPSGSVSVTWDATYSAELILYMQRSEPVWT